MSGTVIFDLQKTVKKLCDVKIIVKRQYTDFQGDIFQNKKYIQSSIKQGKIPIFSFIQQRKSHQLWKSCGV